MKMKAIDPALLCDLYAEGVDVQTDDGLHVGKVLRSARTGATLLIYGSRSTRKGYSGPAPNPTVEKTWSYDFTPALVQSAAEWLVARFNGKL